MWWRHGARGRLGALAWGLALWGLAGVAAGVRERSLDAGDGFKVVIPKGLAPIQLVRKPEHAQGQLEITDEGMAVLLNLTQPLALVSAVGPTRTGKSSLLGRAFLGAPDFFEIGTGVHSHTTGIWCTNKPVYVFTKKYGKMSVIFVDTEGFHGVQEKTSKTYENNLFATAYLLSSQLIYNSAYPVDSHHVDELKGYSRTAINMQRELEKSGVHINRNRPDLLWVVQNFNFYNLENSGMTGDDLLGNLTDSMMLNTLGMADERLENLHGMFNTKSMAPIHRPHDNDKVLANLGEYKDDELKKDYMDDLHRLREKVFRSLEPMQVAGVPINGQDFALNIERWVLYGHIRIDEDEEGIHFVDKRMEAHVKEVIGEYDAKTKEMEDRIRGSISTIDTVSKFRTKLDDVQNQALVKLRQRAKFWNYKLQGSPLEEHLRTRIKNRGTDMLKLYTGQALRVLARFAEGKKADCMDQMKKSLKLRACMQLAVNPTGGKVKPSDAPMDPKALREAARAITRGLESSFKREAAKYELTEDRIGKQYVDEFRRWLAAVVDVIVFGLENTRSVVATYGQECGEQQLRDVDKNTYQKKCGVQMEEDAEQAIRDKALEALPAMENSTDPRFLELTRWVIANQRTALSPLLADAVGAYKQASEQTLGKIAQDLLTAAEANVKSIGVLGLVSGGLEQHLEDVLEQHLQEFDAELTRLQLLPKGQKDCSVAAKRDEGGDSMVVACAEYRRGLEEQIRAVEAGAITTKHYLRWYWPFITNRTKHRKCNFVPLTD